MYHKYVTEPCCLKENVFSQQKYAGRETSNRFPKIHLGFLSSPGTPQRYIRRYYGLPLCAMSSAVTEAMRPVAPGHGATAAPSCCEGRIFGPLSTSVHWNPELIYRQRKSGPRARRQRRAPLRFRKPLGLRIDRATEKEYYLNPRNAAKGARRGTRLTKEWRGPSWISTIRARRARTSQLIRRRILEKPYVPAAPV